MTVAAIQLCLSGGIAVEVCSLVAM